MRKTWLIAITAVIITFITTFLSSIVLINHYFFNMILCKNANYIYGVWIILFISIYRICKIYPKNLSNDE